MGKGIPFKRYSGNLLRTVVKVLKKWLKKMLKKI